MPRAAAEGASIGRGGGMGRYGIVLGTALLKTVIDGIRHGCESVDPARSLLDAFKAQLVADLGTGFHEMQAAPQAPQFSLKLLEHLGAREVHDRRR